MIILTHFLIHSTLGNTLMKAYIYDAVVPTLEGRKCGSLPILTQALAVTVPSAYKAFPPDIP